MTRTEPSKIGYSNGGSDHERLLRIERVMRWVIWLAVGLAIIAMTLAGIIAYMLLPRGLWW